MRILVTGGAGFIASHIVDAYIQQGNEVLVVDNLSSGRKELINSKARFENLDIVNPKLLDIIDSFKPEIINHHAAQIEVRTSVEDPLADAKTNILGTIHLLEAAKKVGSVKKVLFASSGGAVYGNASHIPTTEKEVCHPISPYGIAKLSAEHYLYYYHHEHGLPYVALRYANVYGPRQNPHGEAGVVAIFFQRVLSGQSFTINGTGEQTRDFVFVADVVDANIKATNSNFIGSINIGTSKQTSVNTLVSVMQEAIGNTDKIAHGQAKAGEQSASCLSYDLAITQLGWQPLVTLDQGIKRTADFFKSSLS